MVVCVWYNIPNVHHCPLYINVPKDIVNSAFLLSFNIQNLIPHTPMHCKPSRFELMKVIRDTANAYTFGMALHDFGSMPFGSKCTCCLRI